MQKKPSTFNVVPPFSGVIVAQLNNQMATELVAFFKGQFGKTPEALHKSLSHDPELASFIAHLDDPDYEDQYIGWEPDKGTAWFNLLEANDVIVAMMDSSMRDLLISYISDYEGDVPKTIWAFRLALENPLGKMQERRDTRRPQRDYPSSRPRRFG